MKNQTLGAVLRATRIAHGLDGKDLARLLAVAPSQVTRWETDQVLPSPQALVRLANQLELRASDLFRLAGVPVPPDLASLPAMLRAEYDLPPDAIADIQKHIEGVAAKYRSDGND